MFKLSSLVSWSSSLAEAMSRACNAIVRFTLASLSASWAFLRVAFLSARLAEKFATASLAWASRFLAFVKARFASCKFFSATSVWSGVAVLLANSFSACVLASSAEAYLREAAANSAFAFANASWAWLFCFCASTSFASSWARSLLRLILCLPSLPNELMNQRFPLILATVIARPLS